MLSWLATTHYCRRATSTLMESASRWLKTCWRSGGATTRAAVRRSGEPVTARYVLTATGLQLIAARDAVPPRRYARYGVLAAPNSGKISHRLETLLRQFEHTIGTNSFFARLKRDVDTAGGRLLRWLNAAEATQPFTCHDKRHWLRPDGYAEIELNGKIHRLFLEWDRGTTRRRQHLTEKFKCYADYFSVHPETTSRADLLIVTVNPQREAVIWRFVESAFGSHKATVGVLTSIDSLLDRLGRWARSGNRLIRCSGSAGSLWRGLARESFGGVYTTGSVGAIGICVGLADDR